MRGLTMSKRDLNILLVFLGIVVLLISYSFICNHFRTLEEATIAETARLSPNLAQLRSHKLNIALYEQEIEASKETIAHLRELHPDIVLPEEFIQLAVALESQIDIDIRSITTHGIEAVSHFILPDSDGNPALHDAYRQSFTFTAALGYDAFKDMIKKIYAENERITLDNCSVSYNAEDALLDATVTVSQIFVNDGSYIYQPVAVPAGRIGTSNPFGTLN